MVDLDAMDADPWPTWPVDKNELRGLVDEIERLRAANGYLCSRVDYLPYCHEIERLRAALEKLIAACDAGRPFERGSGGMTIDAQLARTVINGVRASAVEDARAALAGEKKNDAAP